MLPLVPEVVVLHCHKEKELLSLITSRFAHAVDRIPIIR
jgi:hypothetical protein